MSIPGGVRELRYLIHSSKHISMDIFIRYVTISFIRRAQVTHCLPYKFVPVQDGSRL